MENAFVNKPDINVLLRIDPATLQKRLENFLPQEIAEMLAETHEAGQVMIFKALDREKAMEVFELLDLPQQNNLLTLLPHRLLLLILNDMSPDKRTELLEQLDSDTLNRLLKLLSKRERSVALNLLGYPESSVGRLMTPDYIAVHRDWSVQHTLDFIRENGKDSETLDVIYIINEEGKLIDDIHVREILIAPLSSPIEEILDGKFVALSVMDDEESSIAVFRKHRRTALPVTDAAGLLIGIVTIDDVLQLAEDEDTEDIQKIGGVEALEFPYMQTTLQDMIKKRAGWLVILFISEMFTATAMGYFQNEIEKAVVLALFVPLIISSGGNSGSQAATLIIRAMALGEVTLRDWWHIMKKELISGFILGGILGAIGFFRVSAWHFIQPKLYGVHWVQVALTVGISLVGVVTWGSLMGSMLPLVIKRFGADPATSSAPFIATLVDVTGLVIYFSIAMMVMSGTLL